MFWRRKKVEPELLAAFLEGELTPSDAARVQAELANSADLRQKLAQLELIRAALSAHEPEIEGLDLAGRVQAAIQKPAPATSGRPWWLWLAGSAGAFALSAAVFAFDSRSAPSWPEYRSKSLASLETSARWAGVHVYRVRASGETERLGERIARSDGLFFTYTNMGPQPFERLMLFARGVDGQVYWFYPAYERGDSDPESISITQGAAELELPDVVRHALQPGPLVIYALFSHAPLRVSDVEAWLATGREPGREAPVAAGSRLWSVQIGVEP